MRVLFSYPNARNIIFINWYNTMQLYDIEGPIVYPQWLGYQELHKSHRMNLLRKDYEYYAEHFGQDAQTDLTVINEYPYYWPTEKNND